MPTKQATAYARHLTHTHLSKAQPKSAQAVAQAARTKGPLGLFEAKYLGSVPVESNGGQVTCDAAAESLLVGLLCCQEDWPGVAKGTGF